MSSHRPNLPGCPRIRYTVLFCLLLAQQVIALPPDPNNAALLYYQAFLMRPEPNVAAQKLIYDTSFEEISHFLHTGEFRPLADMRVDLRRLEARLRQGDITLDNTGDLKETVQKLEDAIGQIQLGQVYSMDEETMLAFDIREYLTLRESLDSLEGIDVGEEIRDYLQEARPTIDRIESATNLKRCDWGHQYSHGVTYRIPILQEVRPIAKILEVDALLQAHKGQTQTALKRCQQLRQFALHVGDDYTMLYLMAVTLDTRALELIGTLLHDIQADPKMLADLKDQLALHLPSSLSLAKVIRLEYEQTLQSIRKNKEVLDKAFAMQSMLNRNDPSSGISTKEELLARAATPYSQYASNIADIVEKKEMDFEEKEAALRELSGAYKRKYRTSPVAEDTLPSPVELLRFHISILSPDLSERLGQATRHLAYCNRLLVAIELLLVHCRTGQWPEVLADRYPRDPFTGGMFEYERTEKGFALTFDPKNITRSRKRRYEFP